MGLYLRVTDAENEREREREVEKESQLLRGLFKVKMTETYTPLIRKGLHAFF